MLKGNFWMIVFCFENCSELLWEKKMVLKGSFFSLKYRGQKIALYSNLSSSLCLTTHWFGSVMIQF